MEKAVPRYRGAGRSISVSAVPFGPDTDIWRSCRYISALFRALVGLPGGVRRFVSCDTGANHCRLRHIGWEKCGHGLTSRLCESASEVFLNVLLVLFGYPSVSAAALLGGELPLRHCSGNFACQVPTWELPTRGHVHSLVAEFAGIGEVSRAQLPGLVDGARCLAVGEFLGALRKFGYTGNPSTPCRFWQGWEFSVSSRGLEEIEG